MAPLVLVATTLIIAYLVVNRRLKRLRLCIHECMVAHQELKAHVHQLDERFLRLLSRLRHSGQAGGAEVRRCLSSRAVVLLERPEQPLSIGVQSLLDSMVDGLHIWRTRPDIASGDLLQSLATAHSRTTESLACYRAREQELRSLRATRASRLALRFSPLPPAPED